MVATNKKIVLFSQKNSAIFNFLFLKTIPVAAECPVIFLLSDWKTTPSSQIACR
jgi:hypothetical protein